MIKNEDFKKISEKDKIILNAEKAKIIVLEEKKKRSEKVKMGKGRYRRSKRISTPGIYEGGSINTRV